MQRSRYIGPEEALQKARHYCAYQERSHSEVRRKLRGFGLRVAEVDELLSRLIEDDYLNEERFATAFAGGRFRVKKWGRNRILHELRVRGVAEANIRKALQSIDEGEYRTCLEGLARKKWEELGAPPLSRWERTAKVDAYLKSRGFEGDLVRAAMESVDRKEDP
jgi:regulatory protein